MDKEIITFLIITGVLQGNCVSLRRQLEHISKTKSESRGILNEPAPSRRTFYTYDPRELSPILGVPSLPSHLPEAEPILPGHTLIKPALGMLKSAVKFPHKDFVNGAGAYGNTDNIGIRYDSKNERVLYTGFRRMPSDNIAETKPVARSNKKSLYLYDNNVPLSEQKNHGQIYLNRVYLSKVPLVYKVFNVKKKNEPYHRVKILRQNTENDISTANGKEIVVGIDETIDNNSLYRNANEKSKPWSSKYSFDHIVLNQNAPEFSDLFPTTTDNQREWWFYDKQN